MNICITYENKPSLQCDRSCSSVNPFYIDIIMNIADIPTGNLPYWLMITLAVRLFT